MMALGVWQIRRAEWKEALLARYAGAAGLPPIGFPAVPPTDGSLLFRRASGMCLEATNWSARAGSSRTGASGWRHLALCRTGAEGPGMLVDLGWSNGFDAPAGYKGGRVSGVIDSDRDHILLLVADTPAPGLQPSALPSPENIPNNHRAYAVQWFLFAGVAAVIYAIALRVRRRRPPAPPAA
ncbi:SURF1 family protein [Sphingomonas solaris]|uniref:SURF1-like protein n=2 Tax=Alterirhizorhabdus solaris TaxID=2529389 RepID=A0A558QW34_9SPHN|nr:SURF1 family protein [Sphingomonas solaris]